MHAPRVPESGFGRVAGVRPGAGRRPLVGDLESLGVIDPDVLWSCTTCGACVEQCPVDIEHVDHILDMRRYQVLIESAFPSEAGVMLRNLENNGNPWGVNPRVADRVDRGPAVRGPRSSKRGRRSRRRRVAVLGRLRRRHRRPQQEGHPGVRRAAAHRRREVRRPRLRRVLHRRPGAAPRQRVPLPGDGQGQHRDPRRRGEAEGKPQEDRRDLPALLQHARQASTPRSAATTRSSTTPSCSASSWPTAGSPRSRPSTAGHLPRPLLPRAGTTRSTRPRARSSRRSPAWRARRCTAARSGASAAAPAAPGCGWKSGSASRSTSSGSTRRSASTRTWSARLARSAWSCSPTPSPPRSSPARPREDVEVLDVAQLLLRSVAAAKVSAPRGS